MEEHLTGKHQEDILGFLNQIQAIMEYPLQKQPDLQHLSLTFVPYFCVTPEQHFLHSMHFSSFRD